MINNKRKAKSEIIEELLLAYGNIMFELGEFDFDCIDIPIEQLQSDYKELQEKAYLIKCKLLDKIEV